MGAMFVGGALGSAGVTAAWGAGGWTAVAMLGMALGGVATALQLVHWARAAR